SFTVPYVLDEVLGREDSLSDVLNRLNHPATRIVTLVGPGGVGKTCLASEAARQMVQANRSRVAFATLADVADPDQWPRAVLAQLREDPPAESVPLKFLSSLLKESPTTLILDNVETVLPTATEGIRELVSLTPGLQILITSVTPTKVPGEQLVPLGPLDPTTSGRDLLVAALQVTRPQTLSQPGALDELLEISKRLDGYPLALRLAAARLRLLSPKALLDQLESALASSSRGDLPERHRSLETALATSVATLTPDQRATLERIAAYPGGLSMDLAAIQFAGEPYLDHIEALLDSALLRLEEQSDPVRVRLLTPVRQYVWTKLSQQQQTANEKSATENIWKFLDTFGTGPWKPLPTRTLHALDPESDNMAFAWKWSCENESDWAFKAGPAYSRFEIARGRPSALLTQFAQLEKHWQGEPNAVKGEFDLAKTFLLHACSREQEGINLLHEVHALANKLDDKSLLTRAALGLSWHAFRHDFTQATQRANEAIELAEAIGDIYVVAHGQKILSNVANFTYQPEATIRHGYLSYQGLLASDAGTEVATVGGYLAAHLWFQDRADEAAPILERAWAILEETRDPSARAYMTELEGRFAMEVGRYEEAEAYFRESLRLWTTIGSIFQQADQYHSITRALIGQGRIEEARKTVVAAADFWFEDNNQGGTCCSVAAAAHILRDLGKVDEAKKLLAFALAYEKDQELVLVKGELDYRAQLISEIGDIGTNKLETTLAVAHSLFEPLR
ncbi:MAG TPA: AAA family ATPase, partial [Fimbriimonas sp.]|nr:AAA family ATPase [Fimbriimonas sp.]